MSDVIGTILLLALTVTLFGSVFYFVNTFPRPPPQPQGQFAASIVYTTSGAFVADIEILHLAGPTLLDSQTTIYLQSLLHPGLLNGPATLASGLGGGTSWVIGQTWIYNVTSLGLSTPDNITVSVISVDQLLFRQTVPGNPLNIPPEFTQSGVTPATPTLLSTFNIYVGIVDSNLNPNSVWANFTELPGVSSSQQQLSYVSASGTWQCVPAKCTIPASWTNRTGIYYVFVNASDRSGLSSTIAIPVDIVSPTSGGGGLLSLALSLNQSAPVVGVPISVIALLTNNGAAGGTAAVNFTAGATNLGTATNPIGGGTSEAFSRSWTPLASNIGPIFLSATAKLPGVGTAYATLNVTVFPKILLVSHNLNALTVANSNSNESALLANALEAAGIPFTAMTVPCKTVLPASISSYGVAIIDYGTNTSQTNCPSTLSTLPSGELGVLTTAWTAGTAIWVVGADFWVDNPCGQTGFSTFATDFGLKNVACSSAVKTLPTSPTAVYSSGGTLLANGVPASAYKVASTVAGAASFNAYAPINGTVNTASVFLKVNAADAGLRYTSSTHRTAILSFDPSMLVDASAGLTTGTGAASAEVVYNVVDYLAGISSATVEGRAAVDFSVSQVSISGTVHTAQTLIYGAIRSNGPSAGVVSVALYVNGAPALFNGVPVTTMVVISGFATGGGASQFVILFWQAPAAGSYTISIAVSGPGDLVTYNNGLPSSLLNSPTVFT